MPLPAWITGGLSALGGKAIDAWDGYQERKHEIKTIDQKGKLRLRELDYELKAETTRAKIAAKQTEVAHAASWELAQIKNSGWKDEYITILITAPYIAVFIPIPEIQDGVLTGFKYIEQTPVYYQTLLAGVVSAALGIRLWGSITQVNTAVKPEKEP